MRKYVIVSVVILLSSLLSVGAIYKYRFILRDQEKTVLEAHVAELQRQIIRAAAEDPSYDPKPFIVSMRELKINATHLDERTSQPTLRQLVVNKMELYIEDIEAALYQKDYYRANTSRILLRDMLRIFGDPYQISPRFRCVDDAYQNHTFLYGDNDTPSLGSTESPPKEICIEFKGGKRGL